MQIQIFSSVKINLFRLIKKTKNLKHFIPFTEKIERKLTKKAGIAVVGLSPYPRKISGKKNSGIKLVYVIGAFWLKGPPFPSNKTCHLILIHLKIIQIAG